MPEPKKALYGSWKSPVTSDVIVKGAIGLGQIALDGEDIYWLESRPEEGGRNVIVRRTPDGVISDMTPMPFNVRTRVHEYGGGAWTVAGGALYFSNFADNRLYRLRRYEYEPTPLSPEGPWRYADGVIDRHHGHWVGIREDHTTEHQPVNSIVRIEAMSGALDSGTVIASGHDFYASPRLSPT